MSNNLLLINANALIDGTFSKKNIEILNGRIFRISDSIENTNTDAIIDCEGLYLVPGFIDLQVNGAGERSLCQDFSGESIETIYKTHLKYGTTSILPTLTTTTIDKMIEALDIIRKYKNDFSILGIHLEGPFINPIKKGAHRIEYIQKPKDEDLEKLIKYSEGIKKLITIAPEIFSENQIITLVKNGFKVSAGHSNATYDEASRGFHCGISKATHLYNAMSPFTSREPGLVGAVLDNPDIYAGIIVDGHHCHYSSVSVAYKLLKERLLLVSDSEFLDFEKEDFNLYGYKIIKQDGIYISDVGTLAGSNISLLHAVQNCVKHVGIPLEDACRMASEYPAKYFGVDDSVGLIKEGLLANLVLLDKDLNLKRVFVN